MKSRHSNPTFPAAALVALTIMVFGGTSSAATLYGLAQPGWEDDPDPGPPIYTDPIADDTSIYLDSLGSGWRNSNLNQEDIFNQSIGIVVGDGSLGGESLPPIQNASFEITSQWAIPDVSAGTGWVSFAGMEASGRSGTPLAPGFSPGAVSMSNGTLVVDNRTNGGPLVNLGLLPESTDWTVNLAGSVPEPSAALLGTLGTLGLLRRRRVS